jgi:hypothetical protein
MSDDIKVTDKRGQTKEEPKVQEPKAQQSSEQQNDIGFANLVISLGTSAMVHMGIIENPHTKQKEKNLEMAKQEIELIEMLNKKTTGNLTEAEKKVIDQVLYELRLRFVEASK